MDWRWMFCSRLGGRGLLSFVNLGPAGGTTFHPFIPSSLILPLLHFPPCAVPLILLRTKPVGCPHPPLFAFLTLCFISPLVARTSTSSPLPLPSVILRLAFKGRAPTLLAPCFPFDWPNSLFTSPRHKRHQAD